MEWRTTQVSMDQHVFVSDIPTHTNWAVEDTSTGTIVVGIDNARLCVDNSRLTIFVRVRDDIDTIPNEHQILSIISDISGKTIRNIE